MMDAAQWSTAHARGVLEIENFVRCDIINLNYGEYGQKANEGSTGASKCNPDNWVVIDHFWKCQKLFESLKDIYSTTIDEPTCTTLVSKATPPIRGVWLARLALLSVIL
jgi:hypothetical protein